MPVLSKGDPLALCCDFQALKRTRIVARIVFATCLCSDIGMDAFREEFGEDAEEYARLYAPHLLEPTAQSSSSVPAVVEDDEQPRKKSKTKTKQPVLSPSKADRRSSKRPKAFHRPGL